MIETLFTCGKVTMKFGNGILQGMRTNLWRVTWNDATHHRGVVVS